MNSNDWVAEHVMGFKRGSCWGLTGSGSFSSSGTRTSWFSCDWCGQPVKPGLCPKYPFPKFTLVDLMRKLGEKGYHVMVRVDPEREYRKFTVTVNSTRVCDTDSPLKSLCGYLYSKRELWRRFEEVLGPWHGPRKLEKKRFVSGEQVLEETDNYTVRKAMDQMCGIACKICPYTTPESRLANGCVWRTGIPVEPKPILFANIRDAIKLLQKAMARSSE